MTREEAREELKEMIEYEWGTYFTNTAKKHVTSLEMAIKALEQEPTLEKDGTLIVTTEHYENVGRVLVQYGTNGTLFYQDQEPLKPMVEIDLYSVIKQKYIEREVLDKISAEIEEAQTYDGIYIDRAYVLGIIDKYKAESEAKANENEK